MKTVIVAQTREGNLPDSTYELFTFAQQLGGETVLVLVGSEQSVPQFPGKVYLLDVEQYGEYNPEVHKAVVADVAQREQADIVALEHSSFGWDLAPRVAAQLGAAQITEVVALVDGGYEVPCCNAKMRRKLVPATPVSVLTIQTGAFNGEEALRGEAEVEAINAATVENKVKFIGYEAAEVAAVDLSKADVIVSAGRGVGKKDNVEIIGQLAKTLGGELAASRPVVDAGWVDHDRQVGTTGQTVNPSLYVACGISGAIQHLAGMKKSDFVVAINKDKDAPIGEVADVLVVADVLQLVPALIARLA